MPNLSCQKNTIKSHVWNVPFRFNMQKITYRYEVFSQAKRKMFIQNSYNLYKTKNLTSSLNDMKYSDYSLHNFIEILRFFRFPLSRTVCEKEI